MSKTRLIIVLLLGLVLLASFLLSIDYAELWKAIAGARISWIIACLAVGLAAYYFRVTRWKYLLLPIKETRKIYLFKAMIVGFSVTILLPGRIGELVRPYLLGAWENISKSSALATVVLERILDMLCILTYFAVYLYFFAGSHSDSSWFAAVQKSSILALLIGIAGIVFLILWGYKPGIINKVINGLFFWSSEKFRAKLIELAQSFSNGLLVLKHPLLMLKIIALSFIFWFNIVIASAFIIWAFVPSMAFIHSIFITGLLVLGIAIPTPAGVGGFHWAVRIGLVWLGVADSTAAAVALVYHLVSVGPVLLIGIFFIWQEGLQWSKLKQMKNRE